MLCAYAYALISSGSGSRVVVCVCICVYVCLCVCVCVCVYYAIIYCMTLSCTCRSLDDPPNHPAFKAVGDKKPNQVQALTTAVTEMARAMTSSAPASAVNTGTLPTTTAGVSPGKIAILRSNYLQQIRDLHSLFENGAITECEFQEQKLTILEHLKKLSAS